ncbi:MAG: cytochrome c3 family protein [Desulfobacterales bacterium]
MTSKKELQLAYGVAIVLFVVGVISFAAFSAKAPDVPIRIVYEGVAGNAMFTHQTHMSEVGYSVDCYSCHHHGEETVSCKECHLKVENAFAESCLSCHEYEDHEWLEAETQNGVSYYSAESCYDCHDNVADMYAMMQTDAFHGQCIGCHADNDAGPKECSECHLK